MAASLLPRELLDGTLLHALVASREFAEAEKSETSLPDWPEYNRLFHSHLPETFQHLAHPAGAQFWLARQLPSPVVAFLIRSIAVKYLWPFVHAEPNAEFRLTVTRGFQQTPSTVRQPAVRARMLHWLETHPDEIYLFLLLWSLQTPQPEIIASVADWPDSADLPESLPASLRKHGAEAVIAALALAAKPVLLREMVELTQDQERLTEVWNRPEPELANPEPHPEADSSGAEWWRDRAQALEQELAGLRAAQHHTLNRAEKLQSENKRQKEELSRHILAEKDLKAQWEKKLSNTEEHLQAELEKLTQEFDRASRKLRATERERAEFEVENKRLKKQLRHTQQLLEEERRKHSAPEKSASVEAVSPPAPTKKPAVSAQPTPLDEIFEWRADGRPVRLTARAVRRLIDQNDEEAVFTVLQALDALKDADATLYRKFMTRLAEAGEYYKRVLTTATTRVLVDASNVARSDLNRQGKGKIKLLWEVREELRRRDCFPLVFIADASLPYNIDDQSRFREMMRCGEVLMADKGVEADELLARESRRTGAYVLTNDAKFFHKVSPDFEPPRIGFRVYDGTVIVDDF